MINLDLAKMHFFVDKRVSKNNKEYYAIYLSYANNEQLICFVTKSFYESFSK